MFFRNHGVRFRLIDLLMVVSVIAVLLGLTTCLVQQKREAARRNQCETHIRQLALGLTNLASTGRYPNASTAMQREPGKEIGLPLVGHVTVDGQDYAAPGVADPAKGGYSWLVRSLDGLCQIETSGEIRRLSNKYKVPAFSKTMVRQASRGNTAVHFCRFPVPFFRCPTYAGEDFADENQEIYQNIYRHPGISNYACIPGTHSKSKDELVENGVIVSRAASKLGLTLDDVVDGLSMTLIVAETREPNYASWYDGQVNWVTAFSPQHVAAFDSAKNGKDQNGDGIPDTVANEWSTAINQGPSDARDTKNVYMSQFPYTKDQSYGGRRWGPSSMHAGGVVLHAFADQHTTAFAADIDPAVYFALVTRNGNESVGIDAVIRE